MRKSNTKQPLFLIKHWFMIATMLISFFISSIATAEVTNLPIKRTIATQPITALEVIAVVKSFFTGRILSINKKTTYNSPDCHQVKLLEDKGEFQIIRLGCQIVNVKQTEQKKATTEVSNKP